MTPICQIKMTFECFTNTVKNVILQSFAPQLLSKATVKILDCSEGKVLPHFYCVCKAAL